jgi:predicted HTH domain antitoxin
MPVVIPDDVLQQTGLTERELLIELACKLFDLEKLHLWPAAKLAGLSRMEMVSELRKRDIAIYRYSEEDFAQDLATIEHLKKLRESRGET